MDIQPRASEYGTRRHYPNAKTGTRRLAPLLGSVKNGGITELFLENGNHYSAPIGNDHWYWGDIRLIVDSELVLKSKYERVSAGYIDQNRLIWINSTPEVLKLGDWVDSLPTAVNSARDAISSQKEAQKNSDNAKKADEIMSNFDLGKFKDTHEFEAERARTAEQSPNQETINAPTPQERSRIKVILFYIACGIALLLIKMCSH